MIYSRTSGYVICDDVGIPVWIGNPEHTMNPKLPVYETYDAARRALARCWKANRYLTGSTAPLRIGVVNVIVEVLTDPITPKVRDD